MAYISLEKRMQEQNKNMKVEKPSKLGNDIVPAISEEEALEDIKALADNPSELAKRLGLNHNPEVMKKIIEG